MGPINKFDSRVLTQIFYAKTKDEMFYIICMIFTVKLFFLPLFVPSVKEGPLSVLVFSLCTLYNIGRIPRFESEKLQLQSGECYQ